ncbi:MAG: hypothetical protein KJ063_17990 [Anaerolineae bacterium]|nr:hypothetical protein [Anaerolineae bacterium]
MNKSIISLTYGYWRRHIIIGLSLLLTTLLILSLGQLLTSQGNPNPWINFSIHQTRAAYEVVIHWPLVAWHDRTGWPQPTTVMLKNLETGGLQDLSTEFPCNLIGTNFGDLALHGEWLVGVFACEFYAPYQIHALNVNTRELIILPPAPGVPPEQKYAAETTIYGDIIVWQQHNWEMTRSDLFLFDLQSQTVITLTQPPPSVVDWHPELYEDWLAWYRRNLSTGESFIRLYNLSSSEQITLPVTVAQHTWVSLDDQYVVWSDWRNGDSDIYGYDLINRQEIAFITGPAHQGGGVIHEGLLLYIDYGTPRSLHMYHLDSQQTYVLFQQPPQHDLRRQIGLYQGTAVWIDGGYAATGQSIIYGARPLPERFYLPILGHP